MAALPNHDDRRRTDDPLDDIRGGGTVTKLQLIESIAEIHDASSIDDAEGFSQWLQDHKFPELEYKYRHAAVCGYINAVTEDVLQRALVDGS
jgi:hypothetical protein